MTARKQTRSIYIIDVEYIYIYHGYSTSVTSIGKNYKRIVRYIVYASCSEICKGRLKYNKALGMCSFFRDVTDNLGLRHVNVCHVNACQYFTGSFSLRSPVCHVDNPSAARTELQQQGFNSHFLSFALSVQSVKSYRQ